MTNDYEDEIYGVWRDPADKPEIKRCRQLCMVAILIDDGNGWVEFGSVNPDTEEWELSENLIGPHPLMPDKFRVVAWCAIPDFPAHIKRIGDADPDEPILCADGSILDPVTREVVNRLPGTGPTVDEVM